MRRIGKVLVIGVGGGVAAGILFVVGDATYDWLLSCWAHHLYTRARLHVQRIPLLQSSQEFRTVVGSFQEAMDAYINGEIEYRHVTELARHVRQLERLGW